MLRLELRLNNLEEVESWVLSLGTHATVVRPQALVDRIARVARELASAMPGRGRITRPRTAMALPICSLAAPSSRRANAQGRARCRSEPDWPIGDAAAQMGTQGLRPYPRAVARAPSRREQRPDPLLTVFSVMLIRVKSSGSRISDEISSSRFSIRPGPARRVPARSAAGPPRQVLLAARHLHRPVGEAQQPVAGRERDLGLLEEHLPLQTDRRRLGVEPLHRAVLRNRNGAGCPART